MTASWCNESIFKFCRKRCPYLVCGTS